ncbi:MAG: hypothetical protein WEB00_06595 [Dehalococcoidia bacterium]
MEELDLRFSPLLVCSDRPALTQPDLNLPVLAARRGYEVEGLSRDELAAMFMHVAAGHAIDPVNALFGGSISLAALRNLRAGLRRQGWQDTRLGSPQFATPLGMVQLRMRWQLQKPVEALRLPRPLRALLRGVDAQLNQTIGWRFRHHLRIAPPCATDGGGRLAIAGVHSEVMPVLSTAGLRRLWERGLEPRDLRSWLQHTVVDWDAARGVLARDLKAAGFAGTLVGCRHAGVYQGVPFDGRILRVELP